ncbi:MAG: hypothetical protein JNL28_13620 [Planctomycetes bacterium]|nr:hypothetical protein [Planctomycetota bacterium]
MAKKSRRTVLRSSKGKKLYAVRNADGSFKDIQSYERSHRADLAKTSAAEAAAKKPKKKVRRKKAAKKTAAKKAAPKAAKKRTVKRK